MALSYADGIVSFIFGMLSLPTEGRSEEIEDLIKVADYLQTIIGTSGSLFSSNNRQEVYKNIVNLMIDSHSPLWGYLEEILTKRLTTIFKAAASNRVKFLLGLLSRKLAAPIAIFEAANLTIDLVLINQSHRNDPETWPTQGVQWENLYPASGPQNLKATSGNAQVTLNWDSLKKAVKYRIYQGTSSGLVPGGSPVGEVTGTSETVKYLTNQTTYYFIVTGVGVAGTESPASIEVSAKPTASRFTRDADGVITDNATDGLQWFKAPYPSVYPSTYYTWYNAKDWAKGLAVGGGGWEMPTMAQLRPLYPEAYPTGFFPQYTWSADIKNPTDDPATSNDDSPAWLFGIHAGNEGWFLRDNSFTTVAVRSRR
ncbi:MAG: hypothetical protein WA705_10170 [Candidatus Ozemobacteraceae bacterium]